MVQGRQLVDAVLSIGVTEVTYYRWRNEYGGLNGDQVKRLRRCEGLKVPTKQPKRGRLWLNDCSCFSLRSERPNFQARQLV